MDDQTTHYRYEGDIPLPNGRVVDHDDMGREIGVWVPVEGLIDPTTSTSHRSTTL